MRTFSGGATRNDDAVKYDYEGFLSPLALHRFGQYMHEHRKQKDGSVRDSDNWQKGIPRKAYVKSMLRHAFDVWSLHRGGAPKNPDTGEPVALDEALAALLFNVQGLLHEVLLERDAGAEAKLEDSVKPLPAISVPMKWQHKCDHDYSNPSTSEWVDIGKSGCSLRPEKIDVYLSRCTEKEAQARFRQVPA